MNHRPLTIAGLFAITAARLLSPLTASAFDPRPQVKPAPAIELGAPFADNAVLQRDVEFPVWGWSKAGTVVTVEFAGQKETATAGADGKWLLKIQPLKASAAPAGMVSSDSAGGRVQLQNVLVGEVWHASGQSNMEWFTSYAARMEALVRGWREAWGMPQMPFYFTQMQAYGSPNPDEVGMADIRQAQHLFFMNNRSHVGMVVQTDLNPAAPGNIHYQNKLHPGMRLARWALAKDYRRDIACTGPIFEKYAIEGNEAVAAFEKDSLSGGLMAGSKGLEMDIKEPAKFVEPARTNPGEKLNHFRLCGKDRKWHAAEAVIAGDTGVVTSKDVPEPIGVQYAYSAAPMNANLYNKAGLPATPFAAVDGKFVFEEDDPAKAAAEKTKYAQFTDPNYPVFTVAAHYRDGAIIQRDQPIPVWGFANKGVEVTVTLGGVFIDALPQALTPSLARQVGDEKARDVVAGLREMIALTKRKLGPDSLVVANGLRTTDFREILDWEGIDGVMIEHFADFKTGSPEDIKADLDSIALAAAKGKFVVIKGWPGFNWMDKEMMKLPEAELLKLAREEITFPLACFLVAARPGALFCYSWGYTDRHGTLESYPELERTLGASLGEAKQTGWSYQREFAHASVLVNLETKKSRIDWKP